jgi:hypothetical protein
VADKAGNVATYSSDIGQGETVVKNVPSNLLFYAGYNGPAGSAIASDYPDVSASVVGTGSASIGGNGNLVLNGTGISYPIYPIGSTSPIINAAGGTLTMRVTGRDDWSGTRVLFKIPGLTNYLKIYKNGIDNKLYIAGKNSSGGSITGSSASACTWDANPQILTVMWTGASGDDYGNISASWGTCTASYTGTSSIPVSFSSTAWNSQNMYIGSETDGSSALNAIIDYVKIIGGGSS